MYTTVFVQPKNIERILEMINNEKQNSERPYDREVKFVLFNLINYYAGGCALYEIDNLNNKTKTFENKTELNQKMNGANKPDAEKIIKLLTRMFNTYITVCDYWEETTISGRKATVDTGLYSIYLS